MPEHVDEHVDGDGPEQASPAPEVTGRDRLREALRRPGRGQLVVAVLLAAVGFAAVTQVNATEADDTYAGYRQQDLIDVLSGQAGAAERARAEIARLEERRRDLLGRSDRRQAALDQARAEADALNVLAGLVPVSGPGIRIELGANGGVVDLDAMLDLVQELRSAGAEAIEIDDRVRLVAQSAFEATAEGLVVDEVLLESPYVVEAIGEPSTLSTALDFPGGPREGIEDDGASFEVAQLDEVEIASVVEEADPEFASPGSG